MDNLFKNKRTYITKDGDEVLNMSIPSLNMKNLNSNSFMKLNASHNGRLDRFVYDYVSKDIDDGLDRTMYYNHIFNPFAVEEGDIIFTPVTGGEVYQKLSEPLLPDGNVLSNTSLGKKQMTYAEKVEYYAKMGLGIS